MRWCLRSKGRHPRWLKPRSSQASGLLRIIESRPRSGRPLRRRASACWRTSSRARRSCPSSPTTTLRACASRAMHCSDPYQNKINGDQPGGRSRSSFVSTVLECLSSGPALAVTPYSPLLTPWRQERPAPARWPRSAAPGGRSARPRPGPTRTISSPAASWAPAWSQRGVMRI